MRTLERAKVQQNFFLGIEYKNTFPTFINDTPTPLHRTVPGSNKR